jgi:hypothetical protein
MAAVIAFLAVFEIPPFAPKFDPDHPPIPPEYVGDWELVSNEPGQIRILPGGRAEYHSRHGIDSFDVSGARARLTPDRKALSIKLFFFGQPGMSMNRRTATVTNSKWSSMGRSTGESASTTKLPARIR